MSAFVEYTSANRCYERIGKNRIQCHQSGFTLIEAMIVIIVMGVLMAIAVPSVDYQLKNQRNKQTSETIISALREARTESLLRRQNIVIVPSDLSMTLRLNTATGSILRQYNFPEKAPASFANGNITFRSNKTVGFANATGNSIEITTYCNKDKTSVGRKVTLDNNGNIKPITGGSSC